MARILVIEDNLINLELMSYLLQAWHHEAVPAMNGDDGLALARKQRPDLIVCDVQMPGRDGYSVARELKADSALRDIPLLAVTAFAMVGDRDRALAAGFDGHFSKPIDPAAFMAAIEPMLPGRTRAPAAASTAPGEAGASAIAPELRAPYSPCVLLTVDDGPVNIEYKRDLFEPAGYRVVHAHGVSGALELLVQGPVHLVLSDVVMPEGGGFALLRRVRDNAAWHRLPFVFLTSSARDAASRELGLQLGADEFLVRPIDATVLLAAIRRCLIEGRAQPT